MNKDQNYIIKKKAAGKRVRWFAGALLCVVLSGCGKADKALPFTFGETLSEDFDLAEPLAVEEGNAMDLSQGDIPKEQELYVYVCGAVNSPGVVVLPEGSRCNDALEAAGGFRQDADRESVNLAELVCDGMQIYFPTVQEAEEQEAATEAAETGLVDINSAGVEQLCSLPGIGEAKARAIVSYREQNGAFASIEAIMQVPGIKESAYSQIKDLVIAK